MDKRSAKGKAVKVKSNIVLSSVLSVALLGTSVLQAQMPGWPEEEGAAAAAASAFPTAESIKFELNYESLRRIFNEVLHGKKTNILSATNANTAFSKLCEEMEVPRYERQQAKQKYSMGVLNKQQRKGPTYVYTFNEFKVAVLDALRPE